MRQIEPERVDGWAIRQTLPHDRPAWLRWDHHVLITVCAANRGINTLARPREAPAILDALHFHNRLGTWQLRAAVVMPDHVHWLAWVANDHDLRASVANWKRYFARCAQIRWQRDFFEYRLRASDRLEEKCDYLRQNPVRAGLVPTAEDWPYFWSSPDDG